MNLVDEKNYPLLISQALLHLANASSLMCMIILQRIQSERLNFNAVFFLHNTYKAVQS